MRATCLALTLIFFVIKLQYAYSRVPLSHQGVKPLDCCAILADLNIVLPLVFNGLHVRQ